MKDFDLLRAVQPEEGWFAVFGIKGKWRTQELVATREEVDALAEEMVAQGRNVFYGVAKYATDENRTKENVLALRSFWLDIDCGEDKAAVNEKTGRPDGYLTQYDGIEALKAFCKKLGLPKPILVNSGRGVHVYWALTRDVTREEWEPVAARLRELCVKHNFYIDPSVFEVARILRIPGTFNFKEEPALEVTVMSTADPVDFDYFRKLLGAPEPRPQVEIPQRQQSMLGKLLQDNVENNFTKIMRRSKKGQGCQQLWACFEERAELSEPRWFNALSVAKFCKDRDTAIHKMSADHPDYDPASVEQKIKHILGPHTCEQFERNNPGGCEGCPFRGKIKSPIVLGKEIIEAEPEDNIIEVEADDDEEEVAAPKRYIIPEYPFPFFRGKNGGIYKHPMPKVDKDGQKIEQDPILVYARDFYMVKRMYDPSQEDVVYFRLHLPHDGIREFIIPNYKVTDRAELRKELSKKGISCPPKQFEHVMDYCVLAFNRLQDEEKAEDMRTQFGWADNDSKFIHGDREITIEGVFHSPPSSLTRSLADLMVPTGTLDKWKEVFSLYGRPGLEPHAFAALTAFGAPLLKFLGQKGAIINVIHPSSGTGKTTILHMINSVWGAPDKLCLVQGDTVNAKIMGIGLRQHLPVTVDEITNTEAKEFSNLVYAMSQGRGKDRMKASGNELRINTTTWQTISVCSSNASFNDKLSSIKNNPDGELMRLLEYKIDYVKDAIETSLAKVMFDHQLLNNYGHAGGIYAAWLIANREEAEETCLSIQRKIDNELKLTQRERFWSAVLAANISGGLIAKQLGLIDWDMKRIYKWSLALIVDLRQEVTPPAHSLMGVIGDFINRHMQNILVVNDKVDGRSNEKGFPAMEPRGELIIRYEPDTKFMYIVAKHFHKDCVASQISYKDTLAQLKEKGILRKSKPKRLTKGTKIASLPVQCIVLDCNNPEFLSMDEIIAAEEEEHAGGGDQLSS